MDNSEYIEDYFSGAPDPEQTRSFELRIESDPVFAEEVAYYLSVHSLAKEVYHLEKKQQFREIYQNYQEAGSSASTARNLKPSGTTIVRKLVYYLAAAAVVAGISFGIYTYTQNVSPQEMAAVYEREKLTTLPVTMSGRSDSVQTGLRLYNDRKLEDARMLFERMIERDSLYYPALEYAGLACLRLKNYDRAIYYFKQLEERKELYANPALFYKAVTLMARNHPGDNASAKQLLQQVVEKELEGKEAAQKMLAKW